MQTSDEVWQSVPEDMSTQCPTLQHCRAFSRTKRSVLEREVKALFNDCNCAVAAVLVGSLGREEANETSDVDVFLLYSNAPMVEGQKDFTKRFFEQLRQIVEGSNVNLKLASPAGAFASACDLDDLVRHIGGNEENNNTLTRRQLLLTEGYGICANSFFEQSKDKLLMTYLTDVQPDTDRRPIFLLNDLIRYYRTICVDYEYKKNEVGKPWAVRLTKLRHSRKLLYFSSLLPLIESISVPNTERIDWLREQFVYRTPLERIVILLRKYGKETHWKILSHYDVFLKFMSSVEDRERLDNVSFENRDKDELYTHIRNNARAFHRHFTDFGLSVEHWRDQLAKYVLS